MNEILRDCIGSIIAIQTEKGTTFEGYLRKIAGGCIFVDVKDETGAPKGTFILPVESVFLLVKVSQLALPVKNLKIQ